MKLSNRYFCSLSDLQRANFLAKQLIEKGYCVATFNDLQNEFIFEALADISQGHFGPCSLQFSCQDERLHYLPSGECDWFVTVATNIEAELLSFFIGDSTV